jgi:hypothetical protein
MMDEAPSLEEYLESEVESQERSFRLAIVLYLVLSLIVVGYFQILHGLADEYLNERELAIQVVRQSELAFKQNEEKIKSVFKETVPRMARDALRTTVESSIPSLRRSGEELFRRYAREIAGAGSQAATTAFEVIVRDHQTDLLALSGAPPGQYTHRPPGLVHLDRLIEREASRTLNSRPEETVGAKLEASTRALNNIHTRLKSLAGSASGSRKDVLTRRLLSTWWTMVKTGEEETAVDKAMGLRPVERETLKGFAHPE